jgi:hypothetical protein
LEPPAVELRSPTWLAKQLQERDEEIREFDVGGPHFRPYPVDSTRTVSGTGCETIVGWVRNALSDPRDVPNPIDPVDFIFPTQFQPYE